MRVEIRSVPHGIIGSGEEDASGARYVVNTWAPSSSASLTIYEVHDDRCRCRNHGLISCRRGLLEANPDVPSACFRDGPAFNANSRSADERFAEELPAQEASLDEIERAIALASVTTAESEN